MFFDPQTSWMFVSSSNCQAALASTGTSSRSRVLLLIFIQNIRYICQNINLHPNIFIFL